MLVIEAGARQDLDDYDLGRALDFPNPEMVEMFCTHGARASADHLHQAVWRRRPPRTVTALLDTGAPIDAADEGLTPLQTAVRWGEDGVAQLLRDRGATRRRSPPKTAPSAPISRVRRAAHPPTSLSRCSTRW